VPGLLNGSPSRFRTFLYILCMGGSMRRCGAAFSSALPGSRLISTREMLDSQRSGQTMNLPWSLALHPPIQLLSALLLALALTAQTAQAQSPAAESATPPAPLPTGLVTIESDSQKADNATGIITAIGNVRILYPDRRLVATSRQAQYFTKEGRIVLSGDVDVIQEGGNLLRAERVVYLVDSERVVAEPGSGQQVFSQLRLQDNQVSPGTVTPR